MVIAIFVVGLASAAPGLAIRACPNPDGLFYKAHVRQLDGAAESQALHDVFSSPAAHRAAAGFDQGDYRIRDPAWVHFTARLFQRRRLVAP